jgi:NAD-reducing hydrogenase large subunit
MTTRLILDQALDPGAARILVERDAEGRIADARFDLAALPRVDRILAGRPVREVPPLVERLCGVCPVAHHLAGVGALEALAGIVGIPPAAQHLRRLLHYGSVLSVHALRFALDGEDVQALRVLAKCAATAAGSPGHFPSTAVVGGVGAPPDPGDLDRCRAAVPEALAVAQRLALQALARPARPDPFPGADVALVDDAGSPDLLGSRLRAVAGGEVLIAGAGPEQWEDLVAEAVPGSAAPRPYLRHLGPQRGTYRVGPVAQLRVGALGTPHAGRWQQDWWDASGGGGATGGAGGALAARAIMGVHCVEVIAEVLDRIDPSDAVLRAAVPEVFGGADRRSVGTGWVDGARGLLVHRYEVSDEGTVSGAIVLTPTAQNEYWLAYLLRLAMGATPDGSGPASPAVEDAIRDADPCLPCSFAPPGHMTLEIETAPPGAPEAKGEGE